jgi:hypothetical protein
MSDDKAEIKAKVSWPSIFSTIAAGLLLATFNYGFTLLATYLFSEKVDMYFVERPVSDARRFEKLVIIDNFSTNVINEIQFTVTAEKSAVSSQINLEKIEQIAVSPRTSLVKVFGLLPNREASFVLQSDIAIPDDSFRVVKGPNGLGYKSKDKLRDSWFDWSQFINIFMQFLIYIIGMLYFDKRIAGFLAQVEELRTELRNGRAEVEKAQVRYRKIEQENLKNKLVQVRRIMNLTRENRLWRDVALGILEQVARDQNAAKRFLGVIFKNCHGPLPACGR